MCGTSRLRGGGLPDEHRGFFDEVGSATNVARTDMMQSLVESPSQSAS